MSTVRTLNLTLEPDLIEEIKLKAVRENRPVSKIVRQLLREYLDNQKGEKVKEKSKN